MIRFVYLFVWALSPTVSKAFDRLLTMVTTNSIISFVGTMAVANSLSEIASIYPTAGGIRAPAVQIESSVAESSQGSITGLQPWHRDLRGPLPHGSPAGSQLEARLC